MTTPTLIALLNDFYAAKHMSKGTVEAAVSALQAAFGAHPEMLAEAQGRRDALEALAAKCSGDLAARDTVQAAHLEALRASI